jgi:hypothetical protein
MLNRLFFIGAKNTNNIKMLRVAAILAVLAISLAAPHLVSAGPDAWGP